MVKHAASSGLDNTVLDVSVARICRVQYKRDADRYTSPTPHQIKIRFIQHLLAAILENPHTHPSPPPRSSAPPGGHLEKLPSPPSTPTGPSSTTRRPSWEITPLPQARKHHLAAILRNCPMQPLHPSILSHFPSNYVHILIRFAAAYKHSQGLLLVV